MRNPPQRDDHASEDSPRPLSLSGRTRRRFLLALGAGTAGTAAAAARAIAPATPEAVGPPSEGGPGYQETDHVRDYYASARI